MVDWDDLVHREGPGVWRTVYRLVQNQADADECFQETFVAAVKLANQQAVGNWQSLLKRLATARAIDCLRRRLRQNKREDAVDVASVIASTKTPDEQAETAELSGALRWALTQIPARAAEAICLYELEGWRYQEIADHLSLSSGAVGVLLHRARQQLQKLLADVWERRA